jgi:hypothetical protein
MNRLVHLGLLLVSLAAAATGLLHAWLRFARRDEDPFEVEISALEPLAIHAHLFLVPVLLFLAGCSFALHVLPRLGAKEGRASGCAILILIPVLAFGGAALQIEDDESRRTLMGWVHGVAGVLWTLGLLAHARVARGSADASGEIEFQSPDA